MRSFLWGGLCLLMICLLTPLAHATSPASTIMCEIGSTVSPQPDATEVFDEAEATFSGAPAVGVYAEDAYPIEWMIVTTYDGNAHVLDRQTVAMSLGEGEQVALAFTKPEVAPARVVMRFKGADGIIRGDYEIQIG